MLLGHNDNYLCHQDQIVVVVVVAGYFGVVHIVDQVIVVLHVVMNAVLMLQLDW